MCLSTRHNFVKTVKKTDTRHYIDGVVPCTVQVDVRRNLSRDIEPTIT